MLDDLQHIAQLPSNCRNVRNRAKVAIKNTMIFVGQEWLILCDAESDRRPNASTLRLTTV